MKSALAAVLVVVVAALFTGQAQADKLYLTADFSSLDSANALSVGLDGDGNGLSISQTYSGSGAGNSIGVDITGDLNGGPLEAVFAPFTAVVGLAPGALIQSGYDNAMSITVHGSQNLFAAQQSGNDNSLTAAVTGNRNEAAIAQIGSGNTLSFTQSGNGNMLTVIQRSY